MGLTSSRPRFWPAKFTPALRNDPLNFRFLTSRQGARLFLRQKRGWSEVGTCQKGRNFPDFFRFDGSNFMPKRQSAAGCDRCIGMRQGHIREEPGKSPERPRASRPVCRQTGRDARGLSGLFPGSSRMWPCLIPMHLSQPAADCRFGMKLLPSNRKKSGKFLPFWQVPTSDHPRFWRRNRRAPCRLVKNRKLRGSFLNAGVNLAGQKRGRLDVSPNDLDFGDQVLEFLKSRAIIFGRGFRGINLLTSWPRAAGAAHGVEGTA